MPKIIEHSNITQNQIQKNLNSFLATKEGYTALQGKKGLDIVTEVLSGFGSYLAYNNQTMREETFLNSMKLNSSIEFKAVDYGYRFNRPEAPVVSVLYSGPTTSVHNGQILGSYNEQQVVYTGKTTTISIGQLLEVSIGFLQEHTFTTISDDGISKVYIEPQSVGRYISNTIIALKDVNGTSYELSKNLEDLYLNKCVDFSQGPRVSVIYLYDSNLKAGGLEDFTINVLYLESEGATTNLSISKIDLLDNYQVDRILSKGAGQDNHLYVKSILPFYSQSIRRAVKAEDYEYLIKGFNFFKDSKFRFIGLNGVQPTIRFLLEDAVIGKEYSIAITQLSYSKHSVDQVESFTYTPRNSTEATFDNIAINLVNQVSAHANLLKFISPDIGQVFILKGTGAHLNPNMVLKGMSSSIINLHELDNPKYSNNRGVVHYSHISIGSGTKSLTYYEEARFVKYFKEYAMIGHEVDLYPADEQPYTIKLDVEITSEYYQDKLREELELYKDSLNYGIEVELNIDRLIRSVSQYSYEGKKYVVGVNSRQNGTYVVPEDHYLNLDIDLNLTFKS